MHRNVAIPDYRSLVTQTSRMDICQIGYDICEFDSLRGLGIDIIGRVHFDNRDRFSISMGSIGKAIEPCQQTTEWWLTSDFWLFLEPWYARWYEYEIFIASCTDSIYDLENERWLFGHMIDHVGIYGSGVAEGLSTFNIGLVTSCCYHHKSPKYNSFPLSHFFVFVCLKCCTIKLCWLLYFFNTTVQFMMCEWEDALCFEGCIHLLAHFTKSLLTP